MSPIKEKIREEASGIKKEIGNKIAGYITAAFGLVAGLAWNDAIRSSIEYFFPLEKNNLWVKFIYATVLTLVLVIVSVYLIRILKGKDEGGKK